MDVTLLVDDINEIINLVFDRKKITFEVTNSSQELIINGDYDKLKSAYDENMNIEKAKFNSKSKSQALKANPKFQERRIPKCQKKEIFVKK